jgi:hypothetical protein
MVTRRVSRYWNGNPLHLGEPLPETRGSRGCPPLTGTSLYPGPSGRLSGDLSRTHRDRVEHVLRYRNALLTVGARPVVSVPRSPFGISEPSRELRLTAQIAGVADLLPDE